MATKVCSKCGQEKPIEEFPWKYEHLNKRHAVCKPCTAARSGVWYEENKERQLEYVRNNNSKYRENARGFIWDYLATHPCSVCGERDPVVLEFHHVSGKSEEVSRMVGRGASLDAIIAEIEKCVVVCSNCHRRITSEERGWFRK